MTEPEVTTASVNEPVQEPPPPAETECDTQTKPVPEEYGGQNLQYKTVGGAVVRIIDTQKKDDGHLYITVASNSMDGVNDPGIGRWLTQHHLHAYGFGGGTSGLDPMYGGGGEYVKELSTKETPVYRRVFRFVPRP